MCEVSFVRHCLLVRSINLARPDFQLSVFPLSDLPGRREVDGDPVSVKLTPVSDCVIHGLGVTPTKILNFTRRELRVLDFLHPGA